VWAVHWTHSCPVLQDLVSAPDWSDETLVQVYAASFPTAVGMGFAVDLLESPSHAATTLDQDANDDTVIPSWIPADALVGAFDLTQTQAKKPIGFGTAKSAPLPK
jgi:hypothetical protein